MPLYAYQCKNCHYELEEIQKYSDDPLVLCPSCQNLALKRKIESTHFSLRGGGWFADLYASPQKA